jgi:hypothetical protein
MSAAISRLRAIASAELRPSFRAFLFTFGAPGDIPLCIPSGRAASESKGNAWRASQVRLHRADNIHACQGEQGSHMRPLFFPGFPPTGADNPFRPCTTQQGAQKGLPRLGSVTSIPCFS